MTDTADTSIIEVIGLELLEIVDVPPPTSDETFAGRPGTHGGWSTWPATSELREGPADDDVLDEYRASEFGAWPDADEQSRRYGVPADEWDEGEWDGADEDTDRWEADEWAATGAAFEDVVDPGKAMWGEAAGALDADDFDDLEIEEGEAFEELLAEHEQAGGVRFPRGIVLPVVGGATGPDDEHCDPHHTGNPLLDTSDRSLQLSDCFTVGELAKSGTRQFDVARIDPELVRCLQQLRDHLGKPVKVTSGYRSWGYNKEVYKRRNEKKKRKREPTQSRHCSGQAADIWVKGMTGIEIGKAAIDACGVGLGIGDSYAHVDVRGKWATWTYYGEGTEPPCGSRDERLRATARR